MNNCDLLTYVLRVLLTTTLRAGISQLLFNSPKTKLGFALQRLKISTRTIPCFSHC